MGVVHHIQVLQVEEHNRLEVDIQHREEDIQLQAAGIQLQVVDNQEDQPAGIRAAALLEVLEAVGSSLTSCQCLICGLYILQEKSVDFWVMDAREHAGS